MLLLMDSTTPTTWWGWVLGWAFILAGLPLIGLAVSAVF